MKDLFSRLIDQLNRLMSSPDRRALKILIRADGVPVFASDPDVIGGHLRIDPDGARTAGRFENGTFIPNRIIWPLRDLAVPTNRRERIKTLRILAAQILDDEASANLWMKKANRTLGHRRPIDVGKTKEGFKECVKLLLQIEHGVCG
jgi:hypothetical protein